MSQEQHDLRVDYVEFPVEDISRAKQFYGAIFGWKFTDYGEHYTSFTDGRLSGGFMVDLDAKPGGLLVVMYAVDLEALEQKIQQHGGTIVRQIFPFPGGRRFHFKDPSGHVLAVWSDH